MDANNAGYWDRYRLVLLMAAVLLPPFAWLLDMQVSYSLVKWACQHGRTPVLFMMPLGSLTVMVLTFWMSWSFWDSTRRQANEAGGAAVDRSYLLALTGITMSVLFAILVLLSVAPRSVLSPCE